MAFNFSKYINLLDEKKFIEANNYRIKNVPTTLYKFYFLHDIEDCKITSHCDWITEKNEQKFNALENKKVWMPSSAYLNDPFEFKSIYLDKKKLAEVGCSIDFYESILAKIKDSKVLTCFTTNLTNMPMWAHYANDHKGFCVEYKVINSDLIFPVSYEVERIPIATSIVNLITLLNRKYSGENLEEEDLRLYYEILFHGGSTVKCKSWDYEKEYRAIYIKKDFKSNGQLVLLSDLGLEVSKFFLGINCNDINRARLNKISKGLSCSIYEMYLDEYSTGFELSNRIFKL